MREGLLLAGRLSSRATGDAELPLAAAWVGADARCPVRWPRVALETPGVLMAAEKRCGSISGSDPPGGPLVPPATITDGPKGTPLFAAMEPIALASIEVELVRVTVAYSVGINLTRGP
jgi:hypothetical protein